MEVERRKVRKKKKDKVEATTQQVVQEDDLNQSGGVPEVSAQPECLLEPAETKDNNLDTDQPSLLEIEQRSTDQLEDASSSQDLVETEGEAVEVEAVEVSGMLNTSANAGDEATDMMEAKEGDSEATVAVLSCGQQEDIVSEETAHVEGVEARAQDVVVQEVVETTKAEAAEMKSQDVAVQEVPEMTQQEVVMQEVETPNVPLQDVEGRTPDVKESVLQPSAPTLLPSATVTSSAAVLYPSLSEMQTGVETLQPWLEEELCRLYINPQLEALEQFTDNFVMASKRENDEFYELVATYLKAKLALSLSQKQLEVCRNEYHMLWNKAWTIESKDISASGKCGDGRMVTANHTYKMATANREALEALSDRLTATRRLLCDELCMASYSCQVAKLHIEHYLYHLLSSTPGLYELPNNAMVSSHIPSHNPTHLSPETARLKDCISVLFIFERRPVQDESFTTNCRTWLDVLMSALLRVATLSDHQFILHHLLRCPPGIGEWGTKFLQISSPTTADPTSTSNHAQQTNWDPQGYGVGLGLHRDWGGPLLDHLVTQLATLLLPIKQREEFLACLEVPKRLVSTSSDNGAREDGAWQFVTESLECESVDDQTMLKETDFIAFYDQFPINDMFRHILMVSNDGEGWV